MRIDRGWLVCLVLAACGGANGTTVDVPADVPVDAVLDLPGDVPADGATDIADDDGGLSDNPLADLSADVPGDAPADVPGDVPAEVSPDVPPPVSWWDTLAVSGPTVRERIGVSSHMHGGIEANAERDFEIARYQELGAIHVRNDFRWDNVEPVQGQQDWSRVTGGVDAVVTAGGDMLAIIDYGVVWAETNGGGTSSIEPALFGAYAGSMAARLCPQVKLYEVWNEPNQKGFWFPEPNPAHFALFLKAAHDAVMAECPDATIVLGGQAATDSSLGWAFLKDVGTAMPEVCQFFDVLAIHPYTFVQAWSPERDFRDVVGYAYPGQSAMTQYGRDRLVDWGCPDRPVWFTEMGWPSYEISEADQGRWLARSILLSARDDVDRYYIYTFWDGEATTTGTRPHENYFGLFGPPGPPPDQRRAKPSWKAVLGMTAAVGDGRFAGDLSANLGLPNDVYVLAFGTPEGNVVLACWDGRDQPDDGPDGPDLGGPDTTFALLLHLPPDVASVEVLDQETNVVVPAAATGPVSLTLTPAVQYVVVKTGAAIVK